ncbi:MAG: M23 family metallopeptidase [Nitrospinota bacterium]
MHHGIDIDGKEGEEVTVQADGIVVYSYYNGKDSYGNTVIVEHIGTDGKPFYVLYGHLKDENTAEVGQKVKTGDKIGEVGQTGRADGPHKHVELLVPKDVVVKYVDGQERHVPYFGENRTLPLQSKYYDNMVEKDETETGRNRVPTGIPGDVGREDLTTFDKWPKSGDSGSMSEKEEVQKELAPYKKIPGFVPLLTEHEIRKKVKERRRKRSRTSSSSGETLERRGEKVWV